MKYCWVSITQMPSAFNYGNRLIEHCLKDLLGLPIPSVTIDAYEHPTAAQLEQVRECDFMILPGCTLLQMGEHPAMEEISRMSLPRFCFGGAFNSKHPFPDTTYCRPLWQPIGARDPFTHNRLRRQNIRSELIGCPTMFSGMADRFEETDSGLVVFNFARHFFRHQVKILEVLRERHPVSVVLQQESQRRFVPEGVQIVEYEDPGLIIETYSRASLVVTGRLHGALPAIACGTPVLFCYLVPDSRQSLLSHLKIPLHNLLDPRLSTVAVEMAERRRDLPAVIYTRLGDLRERFLSYVGQFRDWRRKNGL